MELFEQFSQDENLEITGIDLEFGKNKAGEEIVITIARAGGSNDKYQKIAEFIFKPYRRQIANESMDTKELKKLLHRIYSEAVVLNWRGVNDDKGKPLTFSKENVVTLFTQLPELFENIKDAAEKAVLFRAQALDVESKN